MLIVQLYSGQNCSTGDYIYRINQPARWLSKIADLDVLNIDLLNVEDWLPLVKAPLLILHHLSDPDLLPVVTKRRELGLTTVYEIADNFRASHQHLPEAKKAEPPEYHVIIEELIKRCDAVQTTGQSLKERYGHLNPCVLILPNLVDEVRTRSFKDDDGFTVGWGGSARHLADLEAYAEALTEWVTQHPDARFAIMASQKIQRLFNKVPSGQLAFYTPGSLQNYLAFLDKLDAGIAPLLPTEFNACRSDVKFLEYAAREVVPLCSRSGPYLDVGVENESILHFNDCSDLIQKLEGLRVNQDRRREIAKRARGWVEKNRLTANYNWQARVEEYKSLMQDDAEINRSVFDELSGMKYSPVSSSLTSGLSAPASEDSISIFKKAVSDSPDNYQAHYFLGWTLSKAGKYEQAISPLQKAFVLNPNSIRTALLLAQTLILGHKIDEAQTIVEKALEVEPNIDSLLNLKRTVLQIKSHLFKQEPMPSF